MPKTKTLAQLKKLLWKHFSLYIRLKNADSEGMVKCVTCGNRLHYKQAQAGHYIPKSSGLSIYFYERNVHVQDTCCNLFKHGNLAQYALFLRRTYGENILEELDDKKNEPLKLSRDDYEALIETYKEKVKELQ